MVEHTVLTHKIAVAGIIFDKDRILFLRRLTPPYIWGLPGGRLNVQEHPELGLRREIHEECQLEIDILGPAVVWQGEHDNDVVLAIIYVCRYVSGKLSLSSEHSEAKWFTLKELYNEMRLHKNEYWGKYQYYTHAEKIIKAIEGD